MIRHSDEPSYNTSPALPPLGRARMVGKSGTQARGGKITEPKRKVVDTKPVGAPTETPVRRRRRQPTESPMPPLVPVTPPSASVRPLTWRAAAAYFAMRGYMVFAAGAEQLAVLVLPITVSLRDVIALVVRRQVGLEAAAAVVALAKIPA